MRGSLVWRASFAVAGLLLLAGGPLHPDGTMEEMLPIRTGCLRTV